MAGFNNDTLHGLNINLSGGQTPSMISDGQLLIGNTAGLPQVATLNSPGTSLSVVNGSGTIGLDINPPVSLANGGTNATSFTQGSVIFMGATAFSQDNSNLFWDATNNRLGIGTTTPTDTLDIIGSLDVDHTAIESDDHALEIECDAAGFGDVKGVDIDFISGAISAGLEEEAILVNIDETASTGGDISGLEVLTTAEGSARIFGVTTGVNIAPVHHNSGTFGNTDDILNIAVDVTAALASGGAGNISIFVADNDTMTIGDAAQFGEMEIILATGASGGGIAPTFEYSTGGVGFSAFSPADGTNGFRNTGAILWEASDLAGWVANATGFIEIRITRTRNNLNTTPIIDELQIAAITDFIWDEQGDVNINDFICAQITIDPGASGDSFVQFDINTTGEFRIGVDDTDDSFRISQGSALGTNDTQVITAGGEVTFPLTPCFLATHTVLQDNVTGNGTTATVNFTTEIFDQNSDYDGTNLFTAPITGRYLFACSIRANVVATADSGNMTIFTTSNRDYGSNNFDHGAVANSGNALHTTMTAIADMDASDTCVVSINMLGQGADTVDLPDNATATWFSGKLIA